MDSVIFQNLHYLKLWLYLLFKARYTPGDVLVGQTVVTLQVGQLIWGRNKAAEILNDGLVGKQIKDPTSWENYLKKFEEMGKIQRKVHNKFTVVTIVKYKFYQDTANKHSQENSQQFHNNFSITSQQFPTKNKENNPLSSTTTTQYPNKVPHWRVYDLYQQAFPKKPLNEFIARSIAEWINDFQGQEEIICLAIKNAAAYSAENFKYVDKTLERWKEQGVKTAADAKKIIADFNYRKQEKFKCEGVRQRSDHIQMEDLPHVPLYNWLTGEN